MATLRPPRALRYGEHRDQVADLWLPAGPPSAVVVSLHGGFFRPVYDRSIHGPLSADLASAGLAVLNAEYRRTGAPGTPTATTDDVAAVVASAVETARSLGPRVRPDVVVVGHSAGGYLALWAAALPGVELVVALAPVADLALAARDGQGGTAVPDWVGGTPGVGDRAYAALDLASRLPTGARTLLVHGTRDDVVPPVHSARYAEAARGAGDLVTLRLLEGEDHFGVTDPGHPAYLSWRTELLASLRAVPHGPQAGQP